MHFDQDVEAASVAPDVTRTMSADVWCSPGAAIVRNGSHIAPIISSVSFNETVMRGKYDIVETFLTWPILVAVAGEKSHLVQ